MQLIFIVLLALFAMSAAFMPKLRNPTTIVRSKYNALDVKNNFNGLTNGIAFSTANDDVELPEQQDSKLSRWFNPNTRGGLLVWCFLLCLIPYSIYKGLVSTGLDESQVGAYVGASFVLLSNVLWASTYIFRVANKDMTYAKQLKDYENAVLQKRLEELADDEINALMEEIEMEDGGDASGFTSSSVAASISDSVESTEETSV